MGKYHKYFTALRQPNFFQLHLRQSGAPLSSRPRPPFMKSLAPLFFAALTVTSALPSGADVIFETSFESPSVKGKTPKAAGADISKPDPSKPMEKPAWSQFEDQPNMEAEGGSVVAGLTNQIARTGKQALYLEASKLSLPYLGALFVSQAIPITGGKVYKACIWGRNDSKNPLVCAGAQLFFKIQIDFYTDEGATETGESQYLLQPLPGGKSRSPFLVSTAWNPVSLRFVAPAAARFVIVSFRCDSNAERGAISGTAYFDDFTVSDDAP